MIIFHVISHFDLGGAERVAINICKSKNKNFTYHIIEVVKGKSQFSKQLIDELKQHQIQYHQSCISNNKLGILLFPIWFLPLYLKYKPDIIHTHTEIPDLSIYLFHLILPIHKKYVRTIHNTELWNKWKFIGRKVESFFKAQNANIAISKATKDEYITAYGNQSIPIIYNGIEKVSQQNFPLLQKNKINILFAGRLEKQKGIIELLSVIKVLSNNDSYFFHIVGNGSLEYLVKEKTANYTTVKLYDKIFGLSSYIGSFDYLLMPSNHEGLALTAIEASFAHTPTIINKCKGLDETLPPQWELTVHNNSIDEYIELFTQKLPTIKYEHLADKAYKYAHSQFEITTMQQKYENIYLKL